MLIYNMQHTDLCFGHVTLLEHSWERHGSLYMSFHVTLNNLEYDTNNTLRSNGQFCKYYSYCPDDQNQEWFAYEDPIPVNRRLCPRNNVYMLQCFEYYQTKFMRYLNTFFHQPLYAGGSLLNLATSPTGKLPRRQRAEKGKTFSRKQTKHKHNKPSSKLKNPSTRKNRASRTSRKQLAGAIVAKSMLTQSEPVFHHNGQMSNTFDDLKRFVQRVFVKEAVAVPATEVLYLDTDMGAIELPDSRQNYFGDGLTSAALLCAAHSSSVGLVNHENTVNFRLSRLRKMHRRVLITRDQWNDVHNFQCFVSSSLYMDGQEYVSGTYCADFKLCRSASGFSPELLFVGKNSRAFLDVLCQSAIEFADLFNQHLL